MNRSNLLHLLKPASHIFLLLIIWALFVSCSNGRNKHKPINYFPMQPGNTWIFNGDIHKMEVTAIMQNGPSSNVTISIYDTSDVFLWKEKYRLSENQLYFESFEPATFILPKVTFDPGLPFAPFSPKPGTSISLEGKETHIDSTQSEMKILVTYEVESIEDVEVPAGLFRNCIKMKINVEYTQFTLQPFFIGEQFWWYAPMVGPVKYDLPSAYGELTEVKLNRSRMTGAPR